MTGRLEGKVAFITGIARGQGLSHALRLAEDGADIIGLDVPRPTDNLTYPMSTSADLDEARILLEKTGRRVVLAEGDVRDRSTIEQLLARGVAELGSLDIVVANAGLCPLGPNPPSTYLDVIEVNYGGVVNTFNAALAHVKDGASLIGIGSVAGLTPGTVDNAANGPGGAGYGVSKRYIAQLVHDLSVLLAPRSIRVNAVHPSNCNTAMLQNEAMYKVFRPDLDSPTADDAVLTFPMMHAIPVPWIEPSDVTAAVAFLASDESRFVTGQQLRVDAGALAKASPNAL